jgi:hypothetical protein
VWESAFIPTDSILNSLVLPKGEILFAGVRNGGSPLLVKTTTDNKVLFEKVIVLSDSLLSVPSMFNDTPGTAVALFNLTSGQAIAFINTAKGELTSMTPLPEAMNFTALRRDLQGNLILVAHPGEILVIRNKGTIL